jgi:homoserine kinase
VTKRRRLVRVPASSANLGPGFDVFAAALSIHLELEVSESGELSVDAGGLDVPEDRSNLCVRAFERLHSADGLRFEIRSEIPLAAGLGSSAAAIVAALVAADHLYELGRGPEELLAIAVDLEGHPDNVAAAMYGGFVLCEKGGTVTRLSPPEGVEPILVIPHGEQVETAKARDALPEEVPLDDATISGAGPAVLVWCFWQDTGKVSGALEKRYGDCAEIRRAPFTPLGADVPEL